MNQPVSISPSPNVLIRDILRTVFPDHDRLITADTHFDNDLMADSLEMVMLALRIENATGVALDDATVGDIETVGALEAWLARQVAA